jgi:hypothetical protein
MKNKKIAIALVMTAYMAIGQNTKNYPLLLSSGEINFPANVEQLSALPATQVFNGYAFRYIQFFNLPSDEQRKQLQQAGIDLLLYMPTNTYIAAIKEGTNLSLLSGYSVRGVYEISAQHKLLKELQVALSEQVFPGFAIQGDKVGLNITNYANLSHERVKQFLTENHYSITYEDANTHWFTVWVKKSDILNFIALPFVCSAELVDDKPTPDNNVGRTDHRSNAISTSYSTGRKYNGAGVNVMLQDDGIIGPHIDYKGRLPNQFITFNNGDHGDHCAGIIMGAGNRNPLTRGMAWGSNIYVYEAAPSYQGFDSINTHYTKYGIRIISTSYSDGCNAGYTTRAQQLDIQNLNMPQLIHVFSGGNQGGASCGYGSTNWGNVTGGHKHSKNSIAVANLDYLDAANASSSRGPAHDGRLKPEVSAVGTNVNSTINPDNYGLKTGTSMSCPGVAGVFAQLYHAYKNLNGNTTPPSALIKAVVMNSADDIGNAGPDFTHGYGRVNALKAVETLEQVKYLSSSISNGGSNTHNITIPAGVRQVKILTYWHDYQAAVSASVALVNNLNTQVVTPSSTIFNPLILDFTPNVTNLNTAAIQGVDVRNNHEQIVIDNPAAGNYALNVSGAAVPFGPQTYYVTWIFYMDGYTITYPMGGEGFVPGETETVRWDAFEKTGNQTLEYTTNNGTSWTAISSTIPGDQRYFNWVVPSALSGECKVRISRGAYNDQSDTAFSIIPLPTNITIPWACVDSVKLTWSAVAGATSYDVFMLGNMYMDSVGTSNTTSHVIPNILGAQAHWFSVRARGPQNAVGRRANAVFKGAGTFACPIAFDAACNTMINPNGTMPTCQNLSAVPIIVNVTNNGLSTLTNVPMFYRVNNGSIITGTFTGVVAPAASITYTFATNANLNTVGVYTIKAWAKYIGDGNITNDTITSVVNVISGTSATLPLNEDFETFSLCSTATTCTLVCGLGNGFINESNANSDQHDWRTNEFDTPSTTTGPSVDYLPGTNTGNYVYLESSVPCTNLKANMLSPCLNLNTINNPLLSFAYHMYGADMGSLFIDVLANGVWYNNVWSASGNKGNTWLTANISLAQWASQTVNIRWRGLTGGGFLSDMALDAINVSGSTGLAANAILNGVNVYPNPGNGLYQLEVNNSGNEILSYEVFDVSGRKIADGTAAGNNGHYLTTVDLKTAANGMYTLIVKRGEQSSYIKLCKY